MSEEHLPIEIPLKALSSETLRGVIESFILREGTDYGLAESPFETKLAQVTQQIESGRAKIVFDPSDESITLLTAQQWQSLHAK